MTSSIWKLSEFDKKYIEDLTESELMDYCELCLLPRNSPVEHTDELHKYACMVFAGKLDLSNHG